MMRVTAALSMLPAAWPSLRPLLHSIIDWLPDNTLLHQADKPALRGHG